MPSADSGETVAAHGIKLIDKDDGRRAFLCLIEKIADPRGSNAYEHLNELGARGGKKRDACLAGHGAGQKRLSGAWRAIKQNAFRDLSSQLLKSRGIL